MTNEQFQEIVIEMLRDLKTDMDRRFDETNHRFDETKTEMDRRFGEMEKRADERHREAMDAIRDERNARIEAARDERIERRQMENKLEKVYESRDKVKITFSWQWGMASFFIAIFAAGITKIFS